MASPAVQPFRPLNIRDRREIARVRTAALDKRLSRELPDLYDEYGPVLVGIALEHGLDHGRCSLDLVAARVVERYGA